MPVIVDNLIPGPVAQEVIQGVVQESVVLRLARTQPMPEGRQSLPVLKTLPNAGFLNTRGARKPVTSIEWSSEQLIAEEVAATLSVPQAYLDDAGFPLWAQVQPRMSEAVASVIDEAVLFGVGAPASFPTGGVFAASQPVNWATLTAPANDMAGAFNAALALVEGQGLLPTGHAADIVTKAGLRGLRSTTGEPIFVPSLTAATPETIYGLPIYFASGDSFDVSQAIAFTADWRMLIVGIRQDIRFDVSDQATIADADGKVLVSAFQDDQVVMRVHMRLACVIGKPVTKRVPGGGIAFARIPPKP